MTVSPRDPPRLPVERAISREEVDIELRREPSPTAHGLDHLRRPVCGARRYSSTGLDDRKTTSTVPAAGGGQRA